jgi:uncharacterized secreted repeat protein (TIGR03808 family)
MMGAMKLDRRTVLLGSLTGAAVLATPATAASLSVRGLDAAQFGLRAGAPDDQSARLQRAIDAAARQRLPLWLAPGVYRAGGLTLPAGAQIGGVRGATRLLFTHGPSLLAAEHAEAISLTGLSFDGGGVPLPEQRGLVHLSNAGKLRIADCELLRAGGNGIALEQCDGEVAHSAITGAADNAIFSIDSRGLIIAANTIRGSSNGGIRVWQSEKRRDGSLIADNRIEDTAARAGGTGQNGNAINVFRAANVIVRNNMIRKAAFSAIRGAAASEIQIIGNNCAELDEVAIYSEFEFEGAVIADNVVDEAGSGISVTNFKEGGRLASVRGNIVRNVRARIPGTAPETEGFGIAVEADTAVTGNVIENAQTAGITAGWGEYLRNVTITGNMVRASAIGVAVSVANGAGTAAISGNMFSDTKRGAIIGMEYRKPVTGDLALAGAERYPQLRITGNQVS